MFMQKLEKLVDFDPPAVVVEAEQAKYQRLVAQGQEAAALEAEGRHANVEWVQALKAAYPSYPHPHLPGVMCTSPKIIEIVMQVRACSHDAAKWFVTKNQSEEYRNATKKKERGKEKHARLLRRAVIELTTKYRLGADPAQCMEALANFYEEQTRGQK